MPDILDDLIPYANPTLTEQDGRATEGRTFSLSIPVTEDGAPVDLSALTATAYVYDVVNGPPILTLAATAGLGVITVTATEAQTAGLAEDRISTRACPWACVLSLSGRSVQVWGPNASTLYVSQGD